jgi:hypothetical protein
MKLTTKQLNKIKSALEYGDKKDLASALGVTVQSISRYLSTGIMPREKYRLMLECINDKLSIQ